MSDLVNHPDHYKARGFEAIDIIEAYELNFALGNAVKYILRADKKANKKQDLEKARWYLEHELDKFNG
jgi:translation initiation factor 2B subunit (eIF-2B alpha/beta/delta family)